MTHIPFFSKNTNAGSPNGGGTNGGGANGGATSQKVAKAPETRKPKLGIALGAGCARGWSHIGVLLELLSQEIKPEVVAGTSIGALVGGAYAIGKLEEMEAFARGLTKRRVMGMMDVSLSGISFLAGERLRRKLEEEFSGFTFEGLAKKFGAVATEFGTGHEVWLTKGNVSEAIRASYTLRNFRARKHRRPLAIRWSACQSNPCHFVPFARRGVRDRRQSHQRPVISRHNDPRSPGDRAGAR